MRLPLDRLPVLLVVLLLVAPPTLAGTTTWHEVVGREALAKGDLDAMTLDAEGVLRPGIAFDALDLDASTAWSAATSDDLLWVGTGNTGRLLRIEGETITALETGGDSVLVTAVAPWRDGGAIAATFPGARLVRATKDGEVSTFATLEAEHVWALAPDGRGGLVAATGMPGALFSIDAFGAVEQIAEIGDDHARCLVRAADRWLVGTAPEGRLLEVRGAKVRVLRDLEPKEVVGIVALEGGGLIVAANDDQAGGNPQQLVSLLNRIRSPSPTKPGQKPGERASLQSGRVLHLEASGAVTTLWASKQVAALSLAPAGRGAVLGTYPSGRLIEVAPGMPGRILADLQEAEASVVIAGSGDAPTVVTSNPAVLHRAKPDTVEGTWTSAPIDAGASARWGRIRLLGRGATALEWRAGETDKPGDGWSEWADTVGFGPTGGGTRARARYVQIRVTLAGEDAELRGVTVAAAAPNRAPVIESVEVARSGGKQNEVGLPTATPLWDVAWKAQDADGDRLQVSVSARRVDQARWIDLVDGKVLEKPKHVWNTAGLPDGAYVLRLVVSDAPDTPPVEARDAVRVTPPFRVDNTPPRIEASARIVDGALRIDGQALDATNGRIALVRVAVDGGPWRVLAAVDGIYDGAAEAFQGDLPAPDSGAHDVVVQAWDDAGNVAARALLVTIR